MQLVGFHLSPKKSEHHKYIPSEAAADQTASSQAEFYQQEENQQRTANLEYLESDLLA